MKSFAPNVLRRLSTLLLVWSVLSLAVPSVRAQTEAPAIPQIEEAEALFEQALAAFERGDYALARRRFQLINEYELNQKTTAALLMTGKAFYRMGEYRRAIDVLNTLIQRYPDTSYRDEARQVLEYAHRALQSSRAPDVIRLGIALPLKAGDAPLAQALFNGIRLAVEEHNGLPGSSDSTERVRLAATRADGGIPDRVVRMYFRDTRSHPDSARAAVDSLVNIDRVDAIIGPLRSPEAQEAAEATERAGVVLMAPLANDESVSAGRRYVFQANPTITMRGEIMARFAVRGLLVDNVGVIFERGNSYSERMAEGFRQEIRRRKAKVVFNEELPNPRAWSRLPEQFAADSLSRDSVAAAEAIYLPISGQDAQGRIQDALTGLDRISRRYGMSLRVLGNTQWHNLPVEKQASQFLATYTNDFYVDETRPAVRDFVRRYRRLTGELPDEMDATRRRLAFTGYDVARFLLQRMSRTSGRPLEEKIRNAPQYEGLGIRIDFKGDNVNHAMFIHRYRNGQIERVR